MKKLVEKISNDFKIRNKLILTYLIVAIITVSVIAIYSDSKMKEIVINRDIAESKSNVDIMQNRLEESLKIATRVSDMIYSDYELTNILTTKYDSYAEVVKDYSSYTALKDYLRYYKEIYDIKIYADNDTLLENENIIRVTNDVKKEEWYNDAIDDNGKMSWKFVKDRLSNVYYLSLVRELKDVRGNMIGVLVMNISPTVLTTITNLNSNKSFVRLDNKIISTQESYESSEENFKTLERHEEISSSKSVLEGNINGDKSYVIVNDFNMEKALNNKFEVVVIIPLTKITLETNKVAINTLKIAIAAIALSMIIILYFSKNISRRINSLRVEMHKVVTGDFNISNDIQGKDEIGQLYADLNIMIDSIKKLINEVYVEKIQKEKLKAYQKDIEFKMLSSQINPHFLYNTLETIRMKAICNDERELADLVKKLGKLMRRNLEVSGKEVSLKSELDLIESYLDIQSVRFEGKVNYNLIISEEIDIESYKILPLLLEPIVENAFIHGLEDKIGKGKILVNIYSEQEKLYIEIEDDGVGIEEERLNQIREKLEKVDDENKSIGITNVNQRMKLYYGEFYGVKIESRLSMGTKVTLCLPI